MTAEELARLKDNVAKLDECNPNYDVELARVLNAAPKLIELAEWSEKARATFNTLSNVSHSEQLVVEICEAAIKAYPEE